MNCRETQQMIDRYLKDTLDERELQAFLGHVRECPSCYEGLEIYYTIHYALDYLDEGRKGAMNPAQCLQQEIFRRGRELRSFRIFRVFQTALVGAALAVVILTAAMQVRFWITGEMSLFWEEGPVIREEETETMTPEEII